MPKTIIPPPPPLEHHSPIESALSLLPLGPIGPDIYTNARPLWHPPGARGIFGGAAIAQCLAAAMATVDSTVYTVHSMHCYFVLAGDGDTPVVYYVERVRDGKSFVTRTVQARQRGKVIFTTTVSFMREGSGGIDLVEHSTPMPSDVPVPPDVGLILNAELLNTVRDTNRDSETPFESVRCKVAPGGKPYQKKLRQWVRARGRISDCPPEVRFDEQNQGRRLEKPGDNHQAHLSALAYMSDSYFVGAIARTHNLRRFANRRSIEATLRSFRGSAAEKEAMREHLEMTARQEAEENEAAKRAGEYEEDDRHIGMMVSLDHTIFFHAPRAFRADEWMLSEMESPWAGDGRGLCLQRIWAKDGTLVATCTQEGVVRLVQGEKLRGSKL